MNELTTYARQPVTAVWGLLMVATALSWMVGTDHDIIVDSTEFATVTVLIIAFAKVQLIGLHFMELRDAPRALTAVFGTWVVAVCAVVSGIYLWA